MKSGSTRSLGAVVPLNAVIYVRVSTKEQAKSLSLDTQQERCQSYCDHEELTVVRVFVEAGESAKTTARTEFQRMLAFATNPKTRVKVVVVYDLSRFARDMLDQARTIKGAGPCRCSSPVSNRERG